VKPYYQDKWVKIYHGDCREILPALSKASAIVTDPPYELGFMGKSWDSKGISFQKETWEVVRTACLSGAPLLSFGGTRTFHRIACAIEDAGWEYRDTLMWVYGSGFPKSLDISKAIDKKQGTYIEGEETVNSRHGVIGDDGNYNHSKRTTLANPQSPEAMAWQGYGTALKPAYEPIIMAMNPMDGTFANNALKHGVAGLNIDECRIGTEEITQHGRKETWSQSMSGKNYAQASGTNLHKGRFPANFIHDGSQMVMELFPNTKSGASGEGCSTIVGGMFGSGNQVTSAYRPSSNGSAARFFYCAKASKAERDRGCEDLPTVTKQNPMRSANGTGEKNFTGGFPDIQAKNNHPTVKPLALMTYLVKLVKMPEYNLVIDPFIGSGTTLLACIKLGIPCIGIDNDEKSCEIAAKRCCQEVMEFSQ